MYDPTSQAYKKARRQHLKTTKNRPADIEEGWTPFRAMEKKYKAKWPPADLSTVLDLNTGDGEADEEQHRGCRGRRDAVEWREVRVSLDEDDGGKGKGKQKAYVFPRVPGLVYLPSFVSPKEQRKLVRWSLKEHAKAPNETNLDAHYILPSDGLWNAYLAARSEDRENEDSVPPRASSSDLAQDAAPKGGPRTLIANPPASPALLPALLALPTPPPTPSPHAKAASPAALIPKLRWANIGWHYHWGNKQYDFTKGNRGGVAEVYKAVCTRAVRGVDWEDVYNGVKVQDDEKVGKEEWRTWKDDYELDAGIVNFYQSRDTLMAHVDRSELCATSPLVSISLGCAAIFLIGGPTRDTEPIPILLRSGDVLIMSGPCRRAYHGVPRILEGTAPAFFDASPEDADDWEPYAAYIRNARINVNVRQVFPRGFEPALQATLNAP